MKKHLLLSVGAAAAMLFASCGGSSLNIEYLPCKADKSDRWGLVGPNGEMLVSDEFENEPSAVVNGYFTVQENGGLSVYKADKKIKIVNDLEKLRDAGVMSEGRMPVVSKGERIRYVDGDGKTLFTLDPVNGKEIVSVKSFFSEGLASFSDSENKVGYLGTDGKVRIEAKFSNGYWFMNGYALVSKENDEGSERWAVINTKGEEIFHFKSETRPEIPIVVNGEIAVRDNDGRISITDINNSETVKLPEKVRGITFFDKKYIIFQEDGNQGIMDREGQVLVRAKYESIAYSDNNLFLAITSGNKASIITADGEEVTSMGEMAKAICIKAIAKYLYNWNTPFEIVNTTRDESGFYSSKGEKVSPKTFYKIEMDFNEEVRSDYFDAEGAVAQLISYLDGTTFGGVRLGASPSSFLKDAAENHRGQDNYTFPNLEGGYRYSISGEAKDIDRYFTTSESVPDGYWYRTVYRYNPESSIDRITFEIYTVPNETYEKLRDAFISQVTAKGWTVDTDNKAYVILSNGSSKMIVTPHGTLGDGINVAMFTSNFWNNNYRSLIDRAVENYGRFAPNEEIMEVEDYGAELEGAALEEVAVADTVAYI